MTGKPTPAATAPKTEPTPTKPTDAPVRVGSPGNGNGSTASTSTGAIDGTDGDAPETTEAAQPGKRPLTVMISERSYKHLRMLAAAEGTSVSAVVIEAVEASTQAKLKAALAALAKDLG